jgi:FtsP/CotA-like multicopper oxidase with cupredoxin domain
MWLHRSFWPQESNLRAKPVIPVPARLAFFVLFGFIVSTALSAQGATASCPRPVAGATISDPPELRSINGTLEVSLHVKYQQTMLGEGPPRYCYVTDDGSESPTLRVRPGDKLIIHLHNDLPARTEFGRPAASPSQAAPKDDCAAMSMDASFTNLHFHGMSVPPVCHQDDVIHTAIPTGDEFDYRVTIPRDAAPGLYWYHPHPHGFSERQVQGGASGALIVEGIENAVPSVRSLFQRILILRDQTRVDQAPQRPTIPAWDISANFVPVVYPSNQPALLEVAPGRKELWRVLNAGADVIFNLQVVVNGAAQPVEIVAIDGVPVSQAGKLPSQNTILLPPGARAEFVVSTPKPGEHAELVTRAWDTGPQGDNDTERPIAEVVPSAQLNKEEERAAQSTSVSPNYSTKIPNTPIRRRLYFSQLSGNTQDADLFVLYFITVAGQSPKTYEMGSPPNIVVHQGDVEDWTIENQSGEDHVFHIHQIHFKVLEIDGKPVNDPTMRDTIDVPYWSGTGPYPSVKLRMDFRNPSIEGTFLYHCHILKHEDMGMMGSIQVLPKGIATTTSIRLTSGSRLQSGDPGHFVASVVPVHAGGSIQFAIDGLDIGKPVPLAGGQAILDTSFVDQGIHRLTATYSGDATFDESAGKVSLSVR